MKTIALKPICRLKFLNSARGFLVVVCSFNRKNGCQTATRLQKELKVKS